MFQKFTIISLAVFITMACDMHDHHNDAKPLPNVAKPKASKTECVIACHKNLNDKEVIASYYLTEGAYKNHECNPKNYDQHVSEPDSPFTKKCNELDVCKDNQCWADANTGNHKH